MSSRYLLLTWDYQVFEPIYFNLKVIWTIMASYMLSDFWDWDLLHYIQHLPNWFHKLFFHRQDSNSDDIYVFLYFFPVNLFYNHQRFSSPLLFYYHFCRNYTLNFSREYVVTFEAWFSNMMVILNKTIRQLKNIYSKFIFNYIVFDKHHHLSKLNNYLLVGRAELLACLHLFTIFKFICTYLQNWLINIMIIQRTIFH